MWGRSDESKAKKYDAVIVPESGSPYNQDVVEDEDGSITHNGKTWMVAKSSVWQEGSKRRIILPEGASESFSGAFVRADYYLKCRLFFLTMKTKLLEQLFNIQSSKPWFKQGSTWAVAGILLLIGLVLAWIAVSISDGLEAVKEGIDGVRISVGDGASSGHQPIGSPRPSEV